VRQRVAAELRRHQDMRVTAARVAELLGAAFAATEVHGRITLGAGPGSGAVPPSSPSLSSPSPSPSPSSASASPSSASSSPAATSSSASTSSPAVSSAADVRWPDDAAPLPASTVAAILEGPPGQVVDVDAVPGGIAVPLPGDTECPPGLLFLVRSAPWGEEERRLLGALAREIEHAVRQQRLHVRQTRLIGELQALDERKDAFVATVTHELRTPLTSILGYTEMLADDPDDLNPAQRRGLEAILRNALRLQDTVADLLLLDPGAGRTGAAAVPVDLAALTTGVVAGVSGTADAKGLLVSVEAEPAWVTGDPERLTRAVRDLVDNAVKFTPAGGHIVCRVGGGPETSTVEITDTGIGVPADDLPGLFTPFHRGANAMDQAYQGSGLGLAIVRDIVTEHGGAVSVRSDLGAGSTFTVSLPALEPPENSSASREPIGRLVPNQ
jgi:two-component system, OmpR family, phosphate regulon sensor histidine kinase PhoR